MCLKLKMRTKHVSEGMFIALKYGAVAMAGAMTHQIFMKQSETERDKAAFIRGVQAYKKNIEEQMALPIFHNVSPQPTRHSRPRAASFSGRGGRTFD